MLRVTRILPLLALFALPVAAADLSGEFTFTKKAPSSALVYFSEDASAPKAAVTIDQADKNFSQALAVAPKGTNMVIKNSDTIQHNIFADDKKQGIAFDSGLTDPGGEVSQAITWDEGQVVKLGCKIHPKMTMYVGSVSSAHHAALSFEKTELKKSFTIAGVPANLTKVTVWVARFDPQEATVAPGGSATIDLTRKGKSYGTLTLTR